MQRVFGVFEGAAGEPRKPVKLSLMTAEQLVEGVPVARNVGCQQLGVTALPTNISPDISPNVSPEAHRRDSNQSVVTWHFTARVRCVLGAARGQDAAWTVISEMSARLLPSVAPNVEIHTSRFDVGEPDLTGMTL